MAARTSCAPFKTAMEEAKEELENANKTYQDSVTEARKNANIDQMLTLEALSGMIYAQNFSMPAGYIDDAEDAVAGMPRTQKQ